MNRKTRFTIRLVAIILVIAAVFMEMGELKLFDLERYRFWFVVIAFALSIISSRR